MNKYAGELLGQDDVQLLLDNLSQSSPSLVQPVVPKPLHSLTGILRELLAERMPISDLRRILETLQILLVRTCLYQNLQKLCAPACQVCLFSRLHRLVRLACDHTQLRA